MKELSQPTAALVLASGEVFYGQGFGASGDVTGEVCFTTGMSGYQETLSDPSFAGQIITFTFPHIGNVGCNAEDIETINPAARGLIVREMPTNPSNWRATSDFSTWLARHGLVGIAGLDTRAITRLIRDKGAPSGVICHAPDGYLNIPALRAKAVAWPGLDGMDLALQVTCAQRYDWTETRWSHPDGYGTLNNPLYHVVAIDYGAKRNILRSLADVGCRVTVVPADTSAETIFGLRPDGVFLSNGPGDPAATGQYAVPVIQAILAARMPVFGICLGHQMLALAIGAKTCKMPLGHRGANHPVKDIISGRVEITSQNHGFCVLPDTLPAQAEITHISLFDGSNEGLRLKDAPAFSVQYHPEASPGPQDSHYLFKRFVEMMAAERQRQAA